MSLVEHLQAVQTSPVGTKSSRSSRQFLVEHCQTFSPYLLEFLANSSAVESTLMINLSPVDGVSGMYNLGDADDVSSTESDQDVETVKTASADAAQPQHDNPFKGFNVFFRAYISRLARLRLCSSSSDAGIWLRLRHFILHKCAPLREQSLELGNPASWRCLARGCHQDTHKPHPAIKFKINQLLKCCSGSSSDMTPQPPYTKFHSCFRI